MLYLAMYILLHMLLVHVYRYMGIDTACLRVCITDFLPASTIRCNIEERKPHENQIYVHC